LNELHTIADPSQVVPVEHSFDVSIPGTYRVTLVDLGAAFQPTAVPLASVKLSVTDGDALIGTPLSAPGTLTFKASVGTYVIHVVGPLGAPGSGPIGIQVLDASNAPIALFSDTLALPRTTLPSNEAALDDAFTVDADGSYVMTLTDLSLPQPLTTLTGIVVTDTGQIVTNPPLATAGTSTVTLQHGVNYRIFAVGQSDAAVNAGLFSANVTPLGGGAHVYSRVVTVGQVAPAESAAVPAGSYVLTVNDL